MEMDQFVHQEVVSTKWKVRTHPDVEKTVETLPQHLVDSFETFGEQLKCNHDLSAFIHTQPFSRNDAVGKRTRMEHYHLRPCRPVCYLVALVRIGDTAYILDIFEHPPQGGFASSRMEERLYARLSDVWPNLAKYKLPGTYRSGLPVAERDMYRTRSMKGTPYVAPIRALGSDYLPLGQLPTVRGERTRIGIIVGTFEIPREEVPDEALQCIDSEEHPDMDILTLYISGWQCYSGIYRKETEHLMLGLCPLHNVVIRTSTRKKPVVVALSERNYLSLVNSLVVRFPPAGQNDQQLGEIVDRLIEHFPISRNCPPMTSPH